MQNQKKRTGLSLESLEQVLISALKTYSNVHRGSGYKSKITTQLFDEARQKVLDYMNLKKRDYSLIFCSPRTASNITRDLNSKDFHLLSSQDIGLSIGLRALAIRTSVLRKLDAFDTGGGTAKLISKDWVIWADGAYKFEAGTPAIINVIAFSHALEMIGTLDPSVTDWGRPAKHEKPDSGDSEELESFSGQELLEKLRSTRIGSNVTVDTSHGKQNYINLDSSASTPTFFPIWEAYRSALVSGAKEKALTIEKVKTICSDFLGAPQKDYDVLFTSNTTEGINIVAENYLKKANDPYETVILNTQLEHSSNDLPWRLLPGSELIRLSVDPEGFIDLNELERLLREYNSEKIYGNKRIKILAISGASNVLGTCNDLSEISRIVKQYDAEILVDAAQLVAHKAISMKADHIDYLVFSAHKIYAPFGSGALIAKKGLLNLPEDEYEIVNSSGEENVAGISALGEALTLMSRIGMEVVSREEHEMTKRLMNDLAKIPGLILYGIRPESANFDKRVGVVVLNLKDKMANKVAKNLSEGFGIGIRAGCHCAHIIVKHVLKISPGLERFQRLIQTLFTKVSFPGVARISIGLENTDKELDRVVEALQNMASRSGKK